MLSGHSFAPLRGTPGSQLVIARNGQPKHELIPR
jgi:hypothetical protein